LHKGSPSLVTPNFVSTALASKDGDELTPEEEYTLMWAAGSMFGGGTDTTVSAIIGFVLCMALFPEVQKRAQDEIDGVTGGKRLPLLSDISNLPYVQCVVREVNRWNPVAPMGNLCLLNILRWPTDSWD
jgi:cytochrome P450